MRNPGFLRQRPESGVVEEVVGRSERFASVPPIWGRFLIRLIRELRPSNCLELGTGFGLSACYLAAALELNGHGLLTTIEIAPERSRIARNGFDGLGLRRVEARVGRLPEALDPELRRLGPIDFAFLDADHRKAATLHCFHSLLPRLAAQAVVVFDDIDWWPQSADAWREIRADPSVVGARDLGRMGCVVVSPARHRRSAAADGGGGDGRTSETAVAAASPGGRAAAPSGPGR